MDVLYSSPESRNANGNFHQQKYKYTIIEKNVIATNF